MANAKREEVARKLARWHFMAEPEITKIIWLGSSEEREDDPLRFLEILPGRYGVEHGIEVFGFDATTEVPYPFEVALVTPKELSLVIADVLSLPEGWSLEGEAVKVFTREALSVVAEADAR